MEPSDLDALSWVSDPRVSPDGSTAAYVVTTVDLDANTYRSRIWTVPLDRSAAPTPVSMGEHRDGQPRWSPDGRSLAFTSTRRVDDHGRRETTLHLLPFDRPGETATLHAGPEAISGLTFSRDGSMLAFSMRVRSSDYDERDPALREPRRIDHLRFMLNGEGFISDRLEHVHVLTIEGGGAPVDVTPGTWECTQPVWFDDGRRLAVTCDPLGKTVASDVAVVDIGDPGALHMLTDGTGIVSSGPIEPGPDGERGSDESILVVGHDDATTLFQNSRLGLLASDATGDRPRWIELGIDRTFAPFVGTGPPTWDDAGVVAAFEDRGNIHLCSVGIDDPDTPRVEVVVDGARTVTGWSTHLDANGARTIVFAASHPGSPAELFARHPDGSEVQLTEATAAWSARVPLVEPEHFVVNSDGVEIDAWVMRPVSDDPTATHPTLLNIHGGPFTQYGNVFFDEFQMQVARGYAVVFCNPRGSSGREDDFGAAIRGPKHPRPGMGWGSVDFDDVMAVVDAAIEQFAFIDESRLGVLGGSYGGYLTSWIVTHSDRFAAACSERSANNLLSLEFGSDLAGVFSAEMGPSHLDDPEEYLRMSPVSYVHDLHTPLLILHSEDDLRCPVEQATQLFVACKLLDKDVEYWLFPNESHELSRSGSPVHRRRRAEIILDFFDRRLAPS